MPLILIKMEQQVTICIMSYSVTVSNTKEFANFRFISQNFLFHQYVSNRNSNIYFNMHLFISSRVFSLARI